ncbi:MAG: efflux RND transporter periplasmic adaptor subunit [Hyphomicrobiales bacterium]|nr:efflux RND transporter periplasmic adaptor subunit [Hyphomicrobiales bacterium]
MTPTIRFIGALTLAASVAAIAAVASPSIRSASERWLAGPATFAHAEDDPIVFYRHPMGEPKVSRVPKKDSMDMDYLPVRRAQIAPFLGKLPATSAPSTDAPLFWRDAMGGPEISPTPKKDAMGMDYLPVRPAEAIALLSMADAAPAAQETPKPAEPAKRRILYYRNPMGLADTSPVPKKDSMGMDYRPVYEGDDEDSSIIKIAPGKVQRTGVRSEPVRSAIVVSKITVPGAIQLDERRVTVVATRSTAFIEKVADVTTGDRVKKGQVLLRLYSPEIAAAAAQYLSNAAFDGARTRLANLGVPSELFDEIERTHKVPLSVAWPAPRDGLVLERAVSDGMKADPGQLLFRLADLSVVWALVDVSERDFSRVKLGQSVAIRARGLPDRTFAGHVSQIYPQINRETRTARVRVELANPDLSLLPDMYVEAEIAASDGGNVATVPDSAVIDSGKRQLVILDKGDGRFEPREVRTGRRGGGRIEIRDGVAEGDNVVTSANFLIDSESNLKAALKTLTQPEAGQ